MGKLDRAYEAAEGLLRSLQRARQLQLILFNDDVTPFSERAVEAKSDQVERALTFIKTSTCGRLIWARP